MPAEPHLHRKPLPIAELLRTLEFDTALAYKASDFHSPEHEAGIRRDDPSIEIAWPLNQRILGCRRGIQSYLCCRKSIGFSKRFHVEQRAVICAF